MNVQLAPLPMQRFFDNNNNPLAGGQLYTYEAGTTTPQATYTDSTGVTANPNPVVLNARGEASVWLTYGQAYKFVLTDAFGNTIWTQDQIGGAGGASLNLVVSSIASLRALSKFGIATAIATGYYASGDGGGGIYWLNTNDTTSSDNGGTIIVANDGGRWYLQPLTFVKARQFGVKADGSTDDTTALLNAIAWVGIKGGYLDCSDCQVMKVSQPVNIGNGTTSSASTINHVYLIGVGGLSPFATIDQGTTLKWAGASGATVAQFLGAMNGGGLLGGWTIDGNGLAAKGLIVNHLSGGRFDSLTIKGCSAIYLTLTAQTNPDTIGGCRNNRFGTYTTDTIESGATGMLIDGPTAITSILQNTFEVVDIPISGTGAIGIQLGYCDFNIFGTVDISRQSTLSTSVGLLLVGSGPSGNQIFPSMNKFQCLAAGCGITSNTTNGRPYGNTIDIYDLADSDGGVPSATGVLGYAPNVLPASGLGVRVMRFGYINPGWTTTTPAVPTSTGSGGKVTNSNSYTVVVYQETSSGNPSGQHIIDGQGTDNAITAVTPMFLLGPGEAVYYTGTLPVSWSWFGLCD
ncbi:hypothetical protein [Burkholderia sp. Ax-1719]|uniref:hypothetical protein n=1 Tax=Burkholderia sp. Ax-1719 TaxID=2608334 RepID=UPI001424950B|nr:hypothetical protein [Burkholderia sp. Ax-1719]NIE67480.1 hypothetical protein [Burkholderia sp. Ax-1719]